MKRIASSARMGAVVAMVAALGSGMAVSAASAVADGTAENGAAAATAGFSEWQRIESHELDALRGREGFKDLVNVQSTQNLEAAVSDSSFTAGTIATGGITVEAGALDNFSGVGLFNMVTGNGNAVNSGVSISIYMPMQTP
ncbi:hypothetical protein EQG41_05600 [Billgrantia azerbaijanica]|nr:hypothetical protein EQG41_05600 [Halomonas azerbaijanica]